MRAAAENIWVSPVRGVQSPIRPVALHGEIRKFVEKVGPYVWSSTLNCRLFGRESASYSETDWLQALKNRAVLRNNKTTPPAVRF